MMISARLALAAVFVCCIVSAGAAATSVTCKDGTPSPGGRGACRGHGGVDKTKSTGGSETSAPKESTAAPEPAAATVTCSDGTTSKGGRGACHGHGGIEKTKAGATPAATPPPAAAKATPPPAPPAARTMAAPTPAAAPVTTAKASHGGKSATDDPAGAIARCKDGMYWHGASHSGSCSHHGGVDSWMDGTQKH